MNDTAQRIVGAVVGGAIGATAFWYGTQRGLLLPAVPGALLGIGIGFRAKRSYAWGAIAAVLCVIFNILVEWKFAAFAVDDSLVYYITHLQDLGWKSQVSLLAVAIIGFYFGMGKDEPEKKGS
jgi:hypothetical protein